MVWKTNKWEGDDDLLPEKMEAGKHYETCYWVKATEKSFNLGQIYVMSDFNLLSPTDHTSFMIVGNEMIWDLVGGDQAYGDQLRFSEDCDAPAADDVVLERKVKFIYPKRTIYDWPTEKRFKLC